MYLLVYLLVCSLPVNKFIGVSIEFAIFPRGKSRFLKIFPRVADARINSTNKIRVWCANSTRMCIVYACYSILVPIIINEVDGKAMCLCLVNREQLASSYTQFICTYHTRELSTGTILFVEGFTLTFRLKAVKQHVGMCGCYHYSTPGRNIQRILHANHCVYINVVSQIILQTEYCFSGNKRKYLQPIRPS